MALGTEGSPLTCDSCGRALPDGSIECQFCATVEYETRTRYPCISGYRILGLLGEGGMGKVYLAEEIALERKVAIKLISEKFAEGRGATARFLREARVMATLEHPHIVRIYALGHVEEKLFLVMEYVEGEVLATLIKKLRKFSIQEALRILRQSAEALEAAWEKKIVHRDIKPSNILLDRKSHVRVADFGLAKPIQMRPDQTITDDGCGVFGTPYYISPEQALEKELDFRSDIYSLGVVLYEMLTGEQPFSGTSPYEIVNQHINKQFPSIKENRSDVSDDLLALLQWMTEKEPQKRPISYSELLQMIDSVLIKSRETHPTELQALRRRAEKERWTLAWLWVPFVAALGAVLLWWNSTPNRVEELREAAPAERGLAVAVTPFYGPETDSQKEGRVIAAFVEKSIRDRLGSALKVIGIDQTKIPLRDHESARTLGQRLGATLVIWGEVFTLSRETEIQPYVTLVPTIRSPDELQWQKQVAEDPFAALAERKAGVVVLEAAAPNQIELRRTSAERIGEVVLLVAGIHSLFRDGDAKKALSLFGEISVSAETLYYRARALFNLERKEEALTLLQEAIDLDKNHAPSHALLGDYYMAEGKFQNAVSEYKLAAATGNAFTTSLGFFDEGKMYTRETFRSMKYTQGKPVDTSYLLQVDTNSGKVVQRYHLPGVPKGFSYRNDKVEIVYDSGLGLERNLSFAHGNFGSPLFDEEDLLLRLQSMQSGWVLAANFITDLETNEDTPLAKFAVSYPAYDDVPQTLEELETALVNAIEKDPTQPWNLFFLGQTYWAQDQKDRAENTWEKILFNNFVNIPYYEFAWMASFFESLGQIRWADNAYREALKRRKEIPWRSEYTTLIDRFVNASFLRQAAWVSQRGTDLPRAHLWLDRAREITGICPEGDDFASAAWLKWYRSKADTMKAIKEADYFKQTQAHPFNMISATTYLDYAFYGLIASTISFLFLTTLLFLNAARYCKELSPFARTRFSISSLFGLLFGTLLIFLSVLISWQMMDYSVKIFLIVAACFLIVAAVLRSRKIALRALAASISSQGRRALALGFFVLVLSLPPAIFFNHVVQSLSGRPRELSDTPKNGLLVQQLEEKLKTSDTPSTRYAAALANHLNGNKLRARELYESISDDQRARKNLFALQSNQLFPPERLMAQDLYWAYVSLPWQQWLQLVWKPGKSLNILYSDEFSPDDESQKDFFSFFFQMTLFLGVFLIVVCYMIPSQRKEQIQLSENHKRNWIISIPLVLLPGAFEIERGRIIRGYIIFALFIFALISLLVVCLIPHSYPFPGIVTFLQMPNYFNSVPFPTPAHLPDMDAIISYHYWTIFWSYPYAKIFWGSVAFAGVFSLTLHAVSLRKLQRAR